MLESLSLGLVGGHNEADMQWELTSTPLEWVLSTLGMQSDTYAGYEEQVVMI